MQNIKELRAEGILPCHTTGFVPGPFKKTIAGADSTPNLIWNRQVNTNEQDWVINYQNASANQLWLCFASLKL
jgi:hypothetical protein